MNCLDISEPTMETWKVGSHYICMNFFRVDQILYFSKLSYKALDSRVYKLDYFFYRFVLRLIFFLRQTTLENLLRSTSPLGYDSDFQDTP